jgi:uncharacterized protein (DUF58 family)
MAHSETALSTPQTNTDNADSSSFIPQPTALNKVRLTLLVGMMFSLLVAGIFRTPPIVFMAAILGVAPPLAIAIGRLSSRRLRVSRDFPASGHVGDVIYGRVRVHNAASIPAFLTEVRAGQINQAPYLMPEDKVPAISAEAGGLHEIALLRPHESIERLQAWKLNRRGRYQLPPARVASTDPLSLFNEPLSSGIAQEITVLPHIVRLERLGFIGGSAARLQAPQHASVVADALDFHGVRPYQPGEPIRRVHWKSTARTGQLQVVEWEENVARDLAIFLDTSRATLAGRGGDNTLETSIVIAASIAQHLLEGGYHLQIFCWQNDHEQTLQLIRHEARNLLDANATMHLLARLTPVENSDATLGRLTHQAALQVPPGCASLIVASTLADLETARRPLQGRTGAPCYTLALDALSFEEKTRDKTQNTSFTQFDALTRLVRRGEPIASVLEQMS